MTWRRFWSPSLCHGYLSTKSNLPTFLCPTPFVFFLILTQWHFFRERGRGQGEDRETSISSFAFLYTSWPGIKPPIFQSVGRCAIQLSHAGQGPHLFLGESEMISFSFIRIVSNYWFIFVNCFFKNLEIIKKFISNFLHYK